MKFMPFVFLLLTIIGAADSKGIAHEPTRPSVVMILVDDLGYGDLSCFGQEKLITPRIDAMAQEGMKFTQFYAGCTVCAPSRSVLMTGQHMGKTVVRGNSAQPIVIQPGQPTLASILKDSGYTTACIGKWGIGTPDNLTNPNDVGFDHFFGYINMWHAHNCFPEFLIRDGLVEKLQNVVTDQWREFQDPTLPQGGKGVAEKRVQFAPDLFIDDALNFIRANHKDPFFLYLSLNIPHANNEGKQAGMEVPSLGQYSGKPWPESEKGFAAMIQNIDRDTGRILDLLKELGVDQNTLVIFTSDNGPHQEGGHKSDFFDSNGPYRGIKRDLYEGGLRVPTIAWWPQTIAAGSTNDRPWYFGDFMATFAELSGSSTPAGTDSISFVPAIKGLDANKSKWHREQNLYWEFYERGSAQAVRMGRWKAIRQPLFTGDMELYDLATDPSEFEDLAAFNPELVERAKNLMDRFHQHDPNWSAAESRNRK